MYGVNILTQPPFSRGVCAICTWESSPVRFFCVNTCLSYASARVCLTRQHVLALRVSTCLSYASACVGLTCEHVLASRVSMCLPYASACVGLTCQHVLASRVSMCWPHVSACVGLTREHVLALRASTCWPHASARVGLTCGHASACCRLTHVGLRVVGSQQLKQPNSSACMRMCIDVCRGAATETTARRPRPAAR